jgi:hypothetical protein
MLVSLWNLFFILELIYLPLPLQLVQLCLSSIRLRDAKCLVRSAFCFLNLSIVFPVVLPLKLIADTPFFDKEDLLLIRKFKSIS